jgi:hypothetical protein
MDPLTIGLALAAKYVPDILKHFGGDTAADVAGKVIDIAQTVTGTSTPQDAERALSLDPEKVMAFQQKVMDNATRLEEIYQAGLDSARKRDIALAQAGQKNQRANWLVGVALLLVIICLFIVVLQSDLDEYAKGVITLILGRALGWVEQIFSFEFGTTRTSKTKDDTISKLSGK